MQAALYKRTVSSVVALLTTCCLLLLVLLCCASQVQADLAPRRLVDMSREDLEDSITLYRNSEEELTDRERALLASLGLSQPDGIQKNELRVMAMRHLNNLDALKKLEAELARRADQPEAARQ